jgi:hypothetical protein
MTELSPENRGLVEALEALLAVFGDTPMPDCASMNRLIAASSRARAALAQARQEAQPQAGEGICGAPSRAQDSDLQAPTDRIVVPDAAGGLQPSCRAGGEESPASYLVQALKEAEVGLRFACADVAVAEGDFVPTPTLALRSVRAALALSAAPQAAPRDGSGTKNPPEPAGGDELEGLREADIASVRDWLRGLAEVDMDDIVADGGITAGMVVQQTAREMAGRLDRALSNLRALRAKGGGELTGALTPTKERIDYVARFGGMCRDCADEGGVCPGSGLPCDAPDKAIRSVMEALRYGYAHGYLALSTPPASQEGEGSITSCADTCADRASQLRPETEALPDDYSALAAATKELLLQTRWATGNSDELDDAWQAADAAAARRERPQSQDTGR